MTKSLIGNFKENMGGVLKKKSDLNVSAVDGLMFQLFVVLKLSVGPSKQDQKSSRF